MRLALNRWTYGASRRRVFSTMGDALLPPLEEAVANGRSPNSILHRSEEPVIRVPDRGGTLSPCRSNSDSSYNPPAGRLSSSVPTTGLLPGSRPALTYPERRRGVLRQMRLFMRWLLVFVSSNPRTWHRQLRVPRILDQRTDQEPSTKHQGPRTRATPTFTPCNQFSVPSVVSIGASRSSRKKADSAARPVSPAFVYSAAACARIVRSLVARSAISFTLSPSSRSRATSRSASVRFQRENCSSMAWPSPVQQRPRLRAPSLSLQLCDLEVAHEGQLLLLHERIEEPFAVSYVGSEHRRCDACSAIAKMRRLGRLRRGFLTCHTRSRTQQHEDRLCPTRRREPAHDHRVLPGSR